MTKRFYREVGVEAGPDGHVIALDGRPLRTPAKAAFAMPARALAEAVAGEWRAQGEKIEPATMPLTRLAGSAVDQTRPHRPQVVRALAAYGETDLTCYRAESPADLVARQAATWQPLLDWLARTHGAALAVTTGVAPVAQAPEALDALVRAVDRGDDFVLTAVHVAATVSGSVVIGLALRDGALDAEGAWRAGQLDETYQIEIWGEDWEAADRRAGLRAELDAAARLLELVRA